MNEQWPNSIVMLSSFIVMSVPENVFINTTGSLSRLFWIGYRYQSTDEKLDKRNFHFSFDEFPKFFSSQKGPTVGVFEIFAKLNVSLQFCSSSVRWEFLAFLFLCSFISYLGRYFTINYKKKIMALKFSFYVKHMYIRVVTRVCSFLNRLSSLSICNWKKLKNYLN